MTRDSGTTVALCPTCKEMQHVREGCCGGCGHGLLWTNQPAPAAATGQHTPGRVYRVGTQLYRDHASDRHRIASFRAEPRQPEDCAANARRVELLWNLAAGLSNAQLATLPPLGELLAAHEALCGLTVEIEGVVKVGVTAP